MNKAYAWGKKSMKEKHYLTWKRNVKHGVGDSAKTHEWETDQL